MATYIQIGSTVTVGSGGAATIDFTSIPSTYTDLVIKASIRTTDPNNNFLCRINGSTSGYSIRNLSGTGGGTYNDATGYADKLLLAAVGANPSTYTANTFSNAEVYFPNYAGSNYKSVSTDAVTENNATSAFATICAGLWSNTAAITSITLLTNSTGIAQYSTASLYGIKKD